jgi:hypothetical protein
MQQRRIPQRASRPADYPIDGDYDDGPPRQHTSAVRYTQPRQQVIQRGNKRIVIHNEPPPRRNLHWSFLLGLGMLTMLGLWTGSAAVLSWWNSHQLDSTYGMPRTYQTDQVVGHGDSTDHPTHFIAVNLNAHITIIEIPGGNSARARIYAGPTLYADSSSSIPVTLEFRDVNGDGKVDMIVHVGDQSIVYLNDGTQFKPQQ